MRRFPVFVTLSVLALLAGCSSAPKPESASTTPAETKAPETKAPEATPAPAEAAKSETPAAATAAPAAATPAAAAPLATDDQRTLYAIGLNMGGPLGSLGLTKEEAEFVARGIVDQAAGKPAIDLEVWGPKINQWAAGRQGKAAEREKTKGKEFLAQAAKKPGAVQTPSGLVYRDLKVGSGASPKASNTVKVNYRGTLLNGKEFDSSYKRNEPIEFPLTGVIPCWTEGVQKMKVGGKAELVCPSDIAYGDGGHPPTIPGGSTLVFEVELLGVK